MAKTKPKLSVLVDANILIRAAMQEQERKDLHTLMNFTNEGKIYFISDGLPAEIEARRKQYEYYRDKLLKFEMKNKEL